MTFMHSVDPLIQVLPYFYVFAGVRVCCKKINNS